MKYGHVLCIYPSTGGLHQGWSYIEDGMQYKNFAPRVLRMVGFSMQGFEESNNILVAIR